MKLFNTRTKQLETFTPLKQGQVSIYSCGPTVYDNIHIGNLGAFITADVLRRTFIASSYEVKHVMNYTDVDDKTIRRSQERYPDLEPHKALQTLTDEYIEIFNADMSRVGNDIHALQFVSATHYIESMQKLIGELYTHRFAYITDDGVYFSLAAYKKAGHTYGQLSEVTTASTASARIQNDEYDKESVHDFALWKVQKGDEPAWDFTLDGHDLKGRPGWHIECSVMSADNLGLPFDIHTGGIDLIFPHHENEIAQSTATRGKDAVYAAYFVHNDHLLVDGRKMSKSLGNFYTLQNITANDYDPLAFRMMMLQSHYRSQTNFTWENIAAAQNRLNRWRSTAELRWQPVDSSDNSISKEEVTSYSERFLEAMQEDLDTPAALAVVDEAFRILDSGLPGRATKPFHEFLELIDAVLGLDLTSQANITEAQQKLITDRVEAKQAKNYDMSDQLRDELLEQGIEVRDTPYATLWNRLRETANHELRA